MFESFSVEVDFDLARTLNKPIKIEAITIEQDGCTVTALEEIWERPKQNQEKESWVHEVWS